MSAYTGRGPNLLPGVVALQAPNNSDYSGIDASGSTVKCGWAGGESFSVTDGQIITQAPGNSFVTATMPMPNTVSLDCPDLFGHGGRHLRAWKIDPDLVSTGRYRFQFRYENRSHDSRDLAACAYFMSSNDGGVTWKDLLERSDAFYLLYPLTAQPPGTSITIVTSGLLDRSHNPGSLNPSSLYAVCCTVGVTWTIDEAADRASPETAQSAYDVISELWLGQTEAKR